MARDDEWDNEDDEHRAAAEIESGTKTTTLTTIITIAPFGAGSAIEVGP